MSNDGLAAKAAQDTPRPEYPRPRFVRPEWHSLNGTWEFAPDPHDQGMRRGWNGGKTLQSQICVPFAYQTELSGVNEKDIYEVVWYARSFEVPAAWKGRDLLLHFGAVDYRTTVWVNGQEVGHNQGGHVPFSFDIAPYVTTGENRIAVRVEDRQDGHQPRGKQTVTGRPKGIYYHCTTGIWQSVWLEPAPPLRIHDLQVTPRLKEDEDAEQDALELRVYLHAPAGHWRIEADILDGEALVAHVTKQTHGATARLLIPIPDARRWSPESPHLYDLRLRLFRDDTLVDEILSYAGVRGVELRDGRLFLNGEPVYLKMALDQGYWPDGGMTAPTDDALRADVEYAKAFGFNGVRKHQKVEDPRWLYWCDRLGLLVWGEMANAWAWSPRSEDLFLAEWERAVRRDYSHPSVIVWVPLNESWGVPDLIQDHSGQYAFMERAVALTRRLDPERPVIDNDGWEHSDVGDIVAVHDYTTGEELLERYRETLNGGPLPERSWGGKRGRKLFAAGSSYQGQPIMFTEVGGFLNVPDLPPEKWDRLYKFYNSCRTPEELFQKYEELMECIAQLRFVSGFCYTQLTDVEQEINGLLTYDRQPKIDPARIAEIHNRLFGPGNRDMDAESQPNARPG